MNTIGNIPKEVLENVISSIKNNDIIDKLKDVENDVFVTTVNKLKEFENEQINSNR